MADAAAPIPALDATFGAMFIGVVIGASLYGVTCLQTWSYYREYPTDTWQLKALVGTVWALDTVHQALITMSLYQYLISNYFNPTYLSQLNKAILVEVIFNGLTAILVQSFFILRIYRLSNRNLWITIPISLVALAQLSVMCAYAAKGLQLKLFAQLDEIKGLTVSINSTTAATDIAIAFVLVLLLNRSRTGFRRSDNIINKLMIFSVNTGLLTSVDALCSLTFVTAMPDKFIYICFFFNLGRLYSNSLMGTLNARKTLARANTSHEDSISGGVVLNTMSRSHAASMNPLTKSQHGQSIAIKIDTTKEFARDHDSDYHNPSAVSGRDEEDIKPETF
ncbi:hypothetical protein EWM64_g7154 [Hericium alpestre]|uniref:DUF6534 domain-containing protein n=1 Tax=Hericium alpestre TaxID=135208 RepID=A0A4Y9ZS26_9AGAM|nr:hypothetical protein EWM64_g7154 [Hericium alpestre]